MVDAVTPFLLIFDCCDAHRQQLSSLEFCQPSSKEKKINNYFSESVIKARGATEEERITEKDVVENDSRHLAEKKAVHHGLQA